MRCTLGLLAMAVLAAPVSSQTGPHLGAEAVLGLAHRTPNALDLPTDGFHGVLRLNYALKPQFRLVAGASLTRFADRDRIVPVLCPVGVTCSGLTRIPGLGLAGLTFGIQPLLPLGPLQLRVTALGGGYWLYHHGPTLPDAAVGTEGAASLALPIGQQLHVLLEARFQHLFGSAGTAGNSRHVGVGIALH